MRLTTWPTSSPPATLLLGRNRRRCWNPIEVSAAEGIPTLRCWLIEENVILRPLDPPTGPPSRPPASPPVPFFAGCRSLRLVPGYHDNIRSSYFVFQSLATVATLRAFRAHPVRCLPSPLTFSDDSSPRKAMISRAVLFFPGPIKPSGCSPKKNNIRRNKWHVQTCPPSCIRLPSSGRIGANPLESQDARVCSASFCAVILRKLAINRWRQREPESSARKIRPKISRETDPKKESQRDNVLLNGRQSEKKVAD